jgi:hypothetical protein
MASKTSGGATGRDVCAPKGNRDDVLHKFGQSASVLRDVLYDDAALDEEEFVFIDQHFQMLTMAYLRWKRKHRPKDEAVPLM